MQKLTYASLSHSGEDFHAAFEQALGSAQKKFRQEHPLFIGGRPVKTGALFETRSPSDTRVSLGRFQKAGPEETDRAVASARNAYRAWREMPWAQRNAFLRKAAEIIRRRQMDLAAWISLETGKPRLEAAAESAQAAEALLYYSQLMEQRQGYEALLSHNGEQTTSRLLPYGVWGVISPFSFPLALPAGMIAAALVTGNTVVLKPSSCAPMCGLLLYQVLDEAGLPKGVVNLLTGSGKTAGGAVGAHPDLDGLVFTGSRAAGLKLWKAFSAVAPPRPCVLEMGGKNPVVVMPTARLEEAVEGITRSAFGFSGQTCSACSRVYVHRDVRKPFLEALVERTRQLRIGGPFDREAVIGPLSKKSAVQRYETVVAMARKEGKLLAGGGRPEGDGLKHGYFVEPAVATQIPAGSNLLQEEWMLPFVVVSEVKDIEEAIREANRSDYGLAAGIFSADATEVRRFFDEVDAGSLYSNRRSGATTGAWPGGQSVSGWKTSALGGKGALGPHYLPQFMREQCQTAVRPL